MKMDVQLPADPLETEGHGPVGNDSPSAVASVRACYAKEAVTLGPFIFRSPRQKLSVMDRWALITRHATTVNQRCLIQKVKARMQQEYQEISVNAQSNKERCIAVT